MIFHQSINFFITNLFPMSFIKKMMYFNKIVSKTKLHCLLFLMGQQTLNHT